MILSRSAKLNNSLAHEMWRFRDAEPKRYRDSHTSISLGLNLRDLGQSAGRLVGFDSLNDDSLSLNRFWLLMSDCRRVTVAELSERELALRWIDLLSLLF